MFVSEDPSSKGMIYFIIKKPKCRINFSPFILLTVFLFNCSKNQYKQINAEFFRISDSTYKFKDYVFQGKLTPDGTPIGKGKLIYNNGIVAEGNFINGFLDDNNATLYYPELGFIKGKFSNGEIMYGTIKYNNGDLYVGTINRLTYQPNGQGEYRRKNLLLVGSFKNGIFDGFGAIIDTTSKTKTFSEFRNGLPNGITGIEEEGKAIVYRDYENGVDATVIKMEKYINTYVNTINSKELQPLKDSISIIKEEINNITAKLAENKKNYQTIENACKPPSAGLIVEPNPKFGESRYSWSWGFGNNQARITPEMDSYERERIIMGYSQDFDEYQIEKELWFIGPDGLTRSEIQEILLKKKQLVKERIQKAKKRQELCELWHQNPLENHDKLERFLNQEYYQNSDLLTQFNNALQQAEHNLNSRIIEQQRLDVIRRNQATNSYKKLNIDIIADMQRRQCLFRPCLFCPPKDAKVTCQ